MQYDVIIIGSGMGALSAGSILARLGRKKVLILEKNFKVGGFTHTFKRSTPNSSYVWDVGLHYVGNMGAGEMPRAVMDLVTGGNVLWSKMPEAYDIFIYPEHRITARAGIKNFQWDLEQAFPGERDGIVNYMRDLKRASAWFGRYAISRCLPRALAPVSRALTAPGAGLALSTTHHYLRKYIRDDELRGVLASQWGDYGLPPLQSAFVTHALIASHYLNGGWYPRGGSRGIADSVTQIIRQYGGEIQVNREVTEITVDGGRVTGVKVKKSGGAEEHIKAGIVISNAGAATTYGKLLHGGQAEMVRKAQANFPAGAAHVNLYLGLRESPAILGCTGANYWIYDSYNHDWEFSRKDDVLTGKAHALYVSMQSLKDPLSTGHTAQIIAPVSYQAFTPWAEQAWKQRDEAYGQLKQTITAALLDAAEKQLPGLTGLVDYAELSTPLSTEHFSSHPGGAMYGIPGTPQRYQMPWIGPRTLYPNLFTAGADGIAFGITGALMGGAIAAALVLKGSSGIPAVFSEAMKFHKSRPREALL